MAKFVKGDVVVVPFPCVLYSIGNLKIEKLRVVIESVIEIIRK
ncbi:MAG: hypothetical protein Q7J76_05885 [Candidatus Brocadiaceae bacterium]|nr:hypothetical protein [Candidatus Brocadiaceae bacterium]